MNTDLSEAQKKEVIRERHDLKNIGHPDINKTIELVTRDFTWPKIRQDITDYIYNYNIYAKVKHSRHRLYGKLQSPAMPREAWSSIALDFIVKLPKSKESLTGVSYDSILVIVNRLTKYIYLISYLEASNVEDLVYIFIKTIMA